MDGFQKGNIPWNKNKKGIHLSFKSEFKKGLIPWNKDKKGMMPIPWNKGKSICLNTGRTHFKKGDKINLGKKRSEESKKRMSEAKKGENAREKHWNWQGGMSCELYSIDWTETLRRSIRERDNYICQLCKKLQGDRVHSVHHIDYDKKNCNPRNLITLCVGCNTKVNMHRNYWINYFTKLTEDKNL